MRVRSNSSKMVKCGSVMQICGFSVIHQEKETIFGMFLFRSASSQTFVQISSMIYLPLFTFFLSKKTQIFFDHIHIFLYFKLFLFTSFLSWHLFSICIFIPFTSLFCSHLFSIRIFYSFASFFRLHLFSVHIFFPFTSFFHLHLFSLI